MAARGEEEAMGREFEKELSRIAGMVSSREERMTTRLETAGVEMRGRGGNCGVEQRRQEKEEE